MTYRIAGAMGAFTESVLVGCGTTPTDIRKTQAALNNLGYRDMNGQVLQVDGMMGAKTSFALAKFAAEALMKGRADTCKALFDAVEAGPSGQQPTPPSGTVPSSQVCPPGSIVTPAGCFTVPSVPGLTAPPQPVQPAKPTSCPPGTYGTPPSCTTSFIPVLPPNPPAEKGVELSKNAKIALGIAGLGVVAIGLAIAFAPKKRKGSLPPGPAPRPSGVPKTQMMTPNRRGAYRSNLARTSVAREVARRELDLQILNFDLKGARSKSEKKRIMARIKALKQEIRSLGGSVSARAARPAARRRVAARAAVPARRKRKPALGLRQGCCSWHKGVCKVHGGKVKCHDGRLSKLCSKAPAPARAAEGAAEARKALVGLRQGCCSWHKGVCKVHGGKVKCHDGKISQRCSRAPGSRSSSSRRASSASRRAPSPSSGRGGRAARSAPRRAAVTRTSKQVLVAPVATARSTAARATRSSAGGASNVVARFDSRSDSGTKHQVRRAADGHLYCSCPAWRFQHRSPQDRTCKHTAAVKAARSTRRRLSQAATATANRVAPPAPRPRKLGKYLIITRKGKKMKWGRLTPPKKHRLQGATKAEHYAWPQGFKYPIHDAAHVRAAQSYFAQHKFDLPMEARKTIARRINQAKKKFGIGGISVVPNRGNC